MINHCQFRHRRKVLENFRKFISQERNIRIFGIRSVDWAQWPPANFESIPAQAVMCARFTSKARFNLKIRDQII